MSGEVPTERPAAPTRAAPRAPGTPLHRWLRRIGKAALGTLAALALLALLEGVISFAVVARSIATKTNPLFRESRQKMTRFDSELGWAPTAGYRDASAFGPGRGVAIGPQGFRGERSVAKQVAPGRVRAVLAGDSFAFGTGVADAETWGSGLERREPRLDVANLAVGGYGCDQAFLRYRRDAAAFEHQLLFFAFITEDLRRMVVPAEWGAEKPQLALRDGKLAALNLPLEQVDPRMRFLRQAGTFVQELRLVQLATRVAGVDRPAPNLSLDAALRELTAALFVELAELAKARGAHLVVIHLPVEGERGGGSIDALGPELAQQVRTQGGDWIDLLDEFRALPEAEHSALFLKPGTYGAGHYDAAACERVAGWIHAELRALPEVARRLDAAR